MRSRPTSEQAISTLLLMQHPLQVVTFPQRIEDTPAFEHHPGRNGIARYLEGRLMGYRWYDTVGRRPMFPFGFGLSYTTFRYSELRLRWDGPRLRATVTVTNTGATLTTVPSVTITMARWFLGE